MVLFTIGDKNFEASWKVIITILLGILLLATVGWLGALMAPMVVSAWHGAFSNQEVTDVAQSTDIS